MSLFQEHLYRELSNGERRLLHDEVGTALEHLYREGSTNTSRCSWLSTSIEPATQPKRPSISARAGDQAITVYDDDEAHTAYLRALDLLEPLLATETTKHRRLQALIGLGRLSYKTNRVADLARYMEEAIRSGAR